MRTSPPPVNATRTKSILLVFQRPRFWISLAVLGVWLGVTVQMVRHEGLRPGAGLQELGITQEIALSTWFDYDHWMKIEQNGQFVGATHTLIHQHSNPLSEATGADSAGLAIPGFELESRTRLQLPVLRFNLPIDVQTRVRMNSAFEMQSLQAAFVVAGQRIDLNAFVEGNALYYAVHSADQATSSARSLAQGVALLIPRLLPEGESLAGRSPLDGPIVFSDVVLPLLLRTNQLKIGQRLNPRVSNPIYGQLEQAMDILVEARERIMLDGHEYDAWRLSQQVGNWQAVSWYDDAGRPLRIDLGNGLAMEMIKPVDLMQYDAAFKTPLPMAAEVDRTWIQAHLDPHLTDVELRSLLPQIPRL